MSKRYFRFISIFIVFQLGVGPALAQGQSDNFEKTKRSQFDPHGLSYDISADKVIISSSSNSSVNSSSNKNQENISVEIPFSSLEALREESPQKLNKKLFKNPM